MVEQQYELALGVDLCDVQPSEVTGDLELVLEDRGEVVWPGIVLGHELVPAMSEALSGGGLTHSSCWPGVTRVAMMKCEWASKRPGVSLLLNSQAPGPRKRRKIPACR